MYPLLKETQNRRGKLYISQSHRSPLWDNAKVSPGQLLLTPGLASAALPSSAKHREKWVLCFLDVVTRGLEEGEYVEI